MNDEILPEVKKEEKNHDAEYLEIWGKQQDIVISRWSIIAIFLNVSFAFLGFSFQENYLSEAKDILRIAGASIYWFSIFLYFRYSSYSHFLRDYLHELEVNNLTSIRLQTKSKKDPRWKGIRKFFSIRILLIIGGLAYIGAVYYFSTMN